MPQGTLDTGAKMPATGPGTFGSDHAASELVAQAVLDPALPATAISIARQSMATNKAGAAAFPNLSIYFDHLQMEHLSQPDDCY